MGPRLLRDVHVNLIRPPGLASLGRALAKDAVRRTKLKVGDAVVARPYFSTPFRGRVVGFEPAADSVVVIFELGGRMTLHTSMVDLLEGKTFPPPKWRGLANFIFLRMLSMGFKEFSFPQAHETVDRLHRKSPHVEVNVNEAIAWLLDGGLAA